MGTFPEKWHANHWDRPVNRAQGPCPDRPGAESHSLTGSALLGSNTTTCQVPFFSSALLGRPSRIPFVVPLLGGEDRIRSQDLAEEKGTETTEVLKSGPWYLPDFILLNYLPLTKTFPSCLNPNPCSYCLRE